MDRRIDTFLRYYDGYGTVIVQLNVEDTRNGVAEYVVDKYGDKAVIELKWGQGAKDIGGEIQVTTYDYAMFLKERGYVVDPDPSQPGVKEAFDHNAIRAFARHSRLGYTDLDSVAAVQENFMQSVEYLRKLGYPRITLKTGSYGMEALAMAIKFASDAELDLLTIDGSGGGYRHESLEHDGLLGSPLGSVACQGVRICQVAGGSRPAGRRPGLRGRLGS